MFWPDRLVKCRSDIEWADRRALAFERISAVQREARGELGREIDGTTAQTLLGGRPHGPHAGALLPEEASIRATTTLRRRWPTAAFRHSTRRRTRRLALFS